MKKELFIKNITKISIILFFELMIGLLLFGSAGTIRLPWFWAYIFTHISCMLIAMRSIDPGLLEERLRPKSAGVDLNLRLLMIPFIAGQLVVAGLDVGRFHWTVLFPWILQAAGLALLAGGMGLAYQAMFANRFFSSAVRIQVERGHAVVTSGPYRFVRHPGYAGMLVAISGAGLALGSWWAELFFVPIAMLVLRRLLIEDRFLKAQLAGYPEYAQKVPWRLVPRVW